LATPLAEECSDVLESIYLTAEWALLRELDASALPANERAETRRAVIVIMEETIAKLIALNDTANATDYKKWLTLIQERLETGE
jgi:hypothetical protein